MRLYLLQHGDAVPEVVDADRPLSDQGRRDVSRLARIIEGSAFRPVRVYHSGKTRARQTADLMVSAFDTAAAPEPLAGLGPKDPVAPIADQTSRWEQDTLIVGHMPFLGRFASRLLAGTEERVAISFQPGSLACLERDDTGRWSLVWMIRPDLLRD
jgi:phosphohistidine phosphatase